ncbi:PAS domain S-box protein [Sulfurimonas sp.]|uniref:PAS domain S-box protein n=1 Tax=Sulfurimonas sp. TaxID=2022749 RepID=UPI00356276CC
MSEIETNSENYNIVFENTNDVIYIVEVTNDGRFIHRDINRAYVENMGIPKEEIVDIYVDELQNKEFREILIDKYSTCVKNQKKTDYTAIYNFPSGPKVYNSVLSPIKDDNGRIYKIVGVARDITKFKKQEKEKIDEQMHLFFECQIIGMAILSPQKTWTKVNQKFCDIFGYKFEELQQMTWSEITYPDDLANDEEQFKRVLNGEIEEYTLKKRFIHKSGTKVYTNLSVSCVRNDDKSVDYFLVMVEDITERICAQEALSEINLMLEERVQASTDELKNTISMLDLEVSGRKHIQRQLDSQEQMFKSIAENTPDPIIRYDKDAKRSYINIALEKITGIAIDELLGKTSTQKRVLSVEDSKRMEESVRQVLKTGESDTIEVPLKSVDGKTIHFKAISTPEFGADGSVETVLMVARDISAQKELEASEEMFRALAENSTDNIARLDKDGRLVYMNPALEKTLNRPFEELKGKTRNDVSFNLNTDEHDRNVQEVLKDGKNRDIYMSVPGDDGEEQHHQIRIHAEKNTKGEITGVLTIGRDVTELFNTQQYMSRFMQNSPGFLYVFKMTPEGKMSFPFASSGIEDIYGLKPEDIAENSDALHNMTHPDDKDYIIEAIKESAQNMTPFHTETRIIKDSVIKWVEFRSIPQKESDGTILWNGIALDITERKEQEEYLQKTKTKLAAVISTIPDLVWVKDKDGVYLMCNPAFENFFGAECDEIIGKTDYDFISKEQADFFRQKDREAMEAGEMRINEESIVFARNNQHAVLETRKIPVYNGDEFMGVLGIGRDITKRKGMEESLRKKEESLNEAQRIAHIGSWELDFRANILSWSDEVFNIFEIDKSKFGASYEAFQEAIHPDDREMVDLVFSESVEKKIPYMVEHRLLMKDGRVKYIQERGETKYDDEGMAIYSMGTVQDITERKEVEILLEKREMEFRSLSENLPDNIARFSKDGTYLFVNPVHEDTLNVKASEVLGKRISEEFPSHKEVINAISEVSSTGEAIKNICQEVYNKNGETEIHEISFIPEKDDNGDVITILAIGRNMTKQIKATNELLLKEFTLNSMVDTAFLIDENGVLHYANDGACNTLGYTKDELLTMNIMDIDPDISTEVWKEYWRDISKNKTWSKEVKQQRKDGKLLSIDVNSRFFEYNGREYVLAVCRDISEKLQMQEKLKEQEKEFRTIMENTPDTVARYDKECVRTYANPSFAKMSGRSIDELIGKKPTHYIDTPQARAYEKAILKVYETAKENEFEFSWPGADGRLIISSISLAPEMDDSGEVKCVLATGRNVTKLKEFENEIKKQKDFQETLLRSIAEINLGVHVIEEGRYIYTNNFELVDEYGYGKDVLEVRPNFLDTVHPDDREYLAMMYQKRLAGEEVPTTYSVGLVNKAGERREHDVSVVIIPNTNPMQTLIVTKDITERKKTEHALEKAMEMAEAANRAKSEFLANMSHEIRTPLNAVLGMAHLLSEEELPEKQKRYATNILTASNALLSLISGVLDFSKIEAGKLEIVQSRFNLYDLIIELRDIFTMRSQEKKIGYYLNINDDVPSFVQGDSIRLKQVLTNLIGNAIKFTYDGFVRVEASVYEKKSTYTVIELGVRDTGIGIARQYQEKLFEKFFQTDTSSTRVHGGTGLGLAISKKLVELMGGTIGVESKIGEGSYIFVRIPFANLEYNHNHHISFNDINTKKNIQHTKQFLEGKKVLIVDDNALNRETLLGVLGRFGCGVQEAINGRDAVIKLGKKKKFFDAVLMDIQMPVMDGYEATKQIRDDGIEIPIIVLSADATQESINKAKSCGADDYLLKPINPNELAQKLAKYLKINFEKDLIINKLDTCDIYKNYKSIDIKQAMQIAGDDKYNLCKLLRNLLQMLHEKYEAILISQDEKDTENIKKLAHTIKGSASNLGLNSISSNAVKIEKGIKKGKDIFELIIELGKGLDLFENELDVLCKNFDIKRSNIKADYVDLKELIKMIKGSNPEAKYKLENIVGSEYEIDNEILELLKKALKALEKYDFKAAEAVIKNIKTKKN